MAGHSKWANIKHRKSRQDEKRGKIFTRLIREINIAARGGASTDDNPRLRGAVANALAANMTRDTINKAIAKGSGSSTSDSLEEMNYEGYGPGGVAILIETATDNRNRTVGEVRHALTKYGGNLGSTGSVNYLFERKGEILLDARRYKEDEILKIALEAGADDLSSDLGKIIITTAPDDFVKVCESLQANNLELDAAEVRMISTTEVEVDVSIASTLLKLLDALEDLDDTQNVYHNASISDQVLEQLNQ